MPEDVYEEVEAIRERLVINKEHYEGVIASLRDNAAADREVSSTCLQLGLELASVAG